MFASMCHTKAIRGAMGDEMIGQLTAGLSLCFAHATAESKRNIAIDVLQLMVQ